MQLTIPTFPIPNWQKGGASVTLRIYADVTFKSSDDVIIQRGDPRGAGNWYKEVACSVSGTTITVPEFTIDSTTDSSDRNATYTGVLFDANGVRRDTFFGAFRIPHNFGASVEWQAIYSYNAAVRSILPYAYPNTDQVVDIVESMLSNLQPEDTDLTAIAAIDSAQSGVIASDGAGWIYKSYSALKSALSIAVADVSGLVSALSGKQDTLISGTSLKTVDGQSLLGSGDVAVGGTVIGKGSLFFDATVHQNINAGVFFRSLVDYSHCFWELWVRPSQQNGTWGGYAIADTEGGAHCILFGVTMSGSIYHVTGNMHDGTTLKSFAFDLPQPAGYWTHIAIGWDGAHILGWIDGFLVYKDAWAPTSRKNPGGNNEVLYFGGSDHNNFWGNIAQVRGYEGYGRCRYVTDFAPERYFRPLSYDAFSTPPQFDLPNLLHNYQAGEQTIYLDASSGFEGMLHHGVPQAQDSVLSAGEVTAPFIDNDLPTFDPEDIIYGDYVPTPPATPVGAIVWDSFSRANVNYLTTREPTWGNTEAGSAGVQTWTALDGSSFPTITGAIVNGVAFIYNSLTGGTVATGTLTQDVRVDRIPEAYGETGLYIRYKDANDYYFVQGTDTNVHVEKREAGVTTSVDYTVSAGWTTLRATASGTSFNFYVGDATEGTFTLAGSFTGTNTAGATRAGLGRYGGNKLVYSFDNFLVK